MGNGREALEALERQPYGSRSLGAHALAEACRAREQHASISFAPDVATALRKAAEREFLRVRDFLEAGRWSGHKEARLDPSP